MEDELHAYWSCPMLEKSSLEAVVASQHLRHQAVEEASTQHDKPKCKYSAPAVLNTRRGGQTPAEQRSRESQDRFGLGFVRALFGAWRARAGPFFSWGLLEG